MTKCFDIDVVFAHSCLGTGEEGRTNRKRKVHTTFVVAELVNTEFKREAKEANNRMSGKEKRWKM